MAQGERPATGEQDRPHRCLLYYITDRSSFPGGESFRRRRLLEKISEAARAGVDYIQLREKDLLTRELESLARDAVEAICATCTLDPRPRLVPPALLINSRTDVALAAGAGGVHLRADDISPREVEKIWTQSGENAASRKIPLTCVSCHSPEEVARAESGGATFAVFAPVFEKKDAPARPAAGLAQLQKACQAKIPVLALGGVTVSNARSCLDAGASGIAAIRLFQENEVEKVVAILRSL